MSRKLAVLVVDDQEDVLKLMSMLLQTCGYQTRTATSGEEALEIVKDFCPDVVLLDVRMPGMDGYEVARKLRCMEPRPQIIGISALRAIEDRNKGYDSGFDYFLLKPASMEDIKRRLFSINRGIDNERKLKECV